MTLGRALRFASVTLAFIGVGVMLAGCPAQKPPPPFTGSMSFSTPPILNQPVQLFYKLVPQEDFDWESLGPPGSLSVRLSIQLPSRFELVEGPLEWQGVVNKGDTIEMKATVKAIEKGNSRIRGEYTLWSSSLNSVDKRDYTLYVLVLDHKGLFSDTDTNLPGWGRDPYFSDIRPGEEIRVTPRLSLSKIPKLGETSVLTLQLDAHLEVNRARIRVELPGVTVVSGTLHWEGDLTPGDRVTLSGVIKPTALGLSVLRTRIEYHSSPTSIGQLPGDYIALYVFKDGTEIIESPPLKAIPRVEIEMLLTNPPALSQQAELTCRATAVTGNVTGVNFFTYLRTTGFQLISGQSSWSGDMMQGVPVEFRVVISLTVTGTLGITAHVRYNDDSIGVYGIIAVKELWVKVTETSAELVSSPTFTLPSAPP